MRRRAAFWVELLNFADFLPALLLSLAAGVIADRVNLRKYLLLLQTIACLLGAGLAVAAYGGWASPRVVIAFTFAEGIVWALNGPPWLSVVPHLVPRAELLLGGGGDERAVQLGAHGWAGGGNGVCFVVGVAVSAFCERRNIHSAAVCVVENAFGKEAGEGRSGAAAAISEGADGRTADCVDAPRGCGRLVDHARRLHVPRSAPATGLLSPYVTQRMNAQSNAFGWLLGAIGIGAILAALIIRRVPAYYPRHHLIPLATMLAGTMEASAFTWTRHPWEWFLLVLIVMGFFLDALHELSTNAAMQLLAADESRGRVMSVMLLCNTGFLPLGHFAAAWLASQMSIEWA